MYLGIAGKNARHLNYKNNDQRSMKEDRPTCLLSHKQWDYVDPNKLEICVFLSPTLLIYSAHKSVSVLIR